MVKPKDGAKKPAKKPKNGYQMPSHLPLNTILQDVAKKQWKIGPSIGSGGFGEIYSACKADQPIKKTEDYPYVVKIEPHGNGPLFVEMHFYMRNCKQEDVDIFKNERGLKNLGTPYYIGSGSHDLEGIKHRFLVMPRYGRDLWSIFLEQGNKFPLHTIYRLCIQIVDVLEYIHKSTYVHADIKGANILLGFGKGGDQQVFLVDFGLASHYTTKDFKPDPKKMHNGTIEYTSRDAHAGVPTMRGDIEILAYNMIQWCGVELPWVTAKLLTNPVKVEQAKADALSDVGKFLKNCFDKTIPEPISGITKYASQLSYNQQPDYNKIRKMMEAGLKVLGKTNSGVLEFASRSERAEKPAVKSKTIKNTLNDDKKKKIDDKPNLKRSRPKQKLIVETDSDDEVEIVPSKKQKPKKEVSDEEDEIMPAKKDRGVARRVVSSPEISPVMESKKKKIIEITEPSILNEKKKDKSDASSSSRIHLNSDKGKSKKKIELHFQLDVSIDTDVVVNVHRKDKKNKNSGAKKENKKHKANKSVKSEDEIPNSDENSSYVARIIKTPVVKKLPSPKKGIAANRAGEYKGKLAKKT